jgi:hypothetical protein
LGLQHWATLVPLILFPALTAELTKWAIRRGEAAHEME